VLGHAKLSRISMILFLFWQQGRNSISSKSPIF
jgi:hypothetical protein